MPRKNGLATVVLMKKHSFSGGRCPPAWKAVVTAFGKECHETESGTYLIYGGKNHEPYIQDK